MDIDWIKFRAELEAQGQIYWIQHKNRKKIETPSAMRKRLKAIEGQLGKLEAAINSVPYTPPDLTPVRQWVQDLFLLYASLEAADKFGFAGRSNYFRDMLCEWLLIEWVNTLGGDLSFSRDEFQTPYGPLIDFLSIVLTAILGRAPGPSGAAKIIEQHRKADD
ncbi:hypothetical protein AB8Z38_24570 [Bradyrhizobium sp. LLZ17]|uniref:Uncharacterized protein n=1 Tax=Bradyrhizobium sp. LLZ17 TaxID=3239388 RepID=A0AB39XD34_9BRAD